MAMTKVVSIKVPDDMAILQSRLTAAAKAAQMPVWELMSRMLDDWEKKVGNGGEPTGSGWAEWRTAIQSEVQSLKAELAATKAQGSSGLLVNQESQADMTPPSGDVSEEAEEESQESLLVNQVNQVNQNDIKAFDETFDNLVRGRYDVLIWKLRKKLNWTRERFDAIVKHLRDEGRYQLQAAEKDKMTKAQIAAGFWDENGNEYQAILRLPAAASAPMGEPEPEPEALAVLAPESEAPKPQNQKGRGKTAEAVGATEATIEETKKQRRGPGRPRKPRNEDTTTKLVK